MITKQTALIKNWGIKLFVSLLLLLNPLSFPVQAYVKAASDHPGQSKSAANIDRSPIRSVSASASLVGIANDGFENGPDGSWTVYSALSRQLIFVSASFPGGITAHTGQGLAWLAGADNEISSITQTVPITAEASRLSFWMWIVSDDVCSYYDFAQVFVNATQVYFKNLCTNNITNGWVQTTLDLSAYAGQSVALQFYAQTDDSFRSSFIVDDVALIRSVNAAPVITEGAFADVTMSEDGSPTAFNLTLNATDNDGDTLTWSISSLASHGIATASGMGNSMAIGYTPTLNYNGSDSFVVQVSDGYGGMDSITVNVTIQAVNDAPVITEGASTNVTMSEDGSPTAFSLTLHATDAEGDTLTWSITGLASHGTATASGTGNSMAIDYTPTLNYIGSDSFVVQVSDGQGGTNSITVNVIVEPAASNLIYLPLIFR